MIAMWVIENVDDAGEGMFVCNARTKKIALKMHAKKNPRVKVTSCYRAKWVDLALVSGKLGESYYFKRAREAEVVCDCNEDMTKAYGGHRPGCPNAIPF